MPIGIMRTSEARSDSYGVRQFRLPWRWWCGGQAAWRLTSRPAPRTSTNPARHVTRENGSSYMLSLRSCVIMFNENDD